MIANQNYYTNLWISFSPLSRKEFSQQKNERLADAPLIIVRLRLNEAWHQQALIHVFGEKDNERQIQHISYFYRLVPHSQFFISLDLSPLSNDLTPSQNDWNIENSSWKLLPHEPALKSSIFHQQCSVAPSIIWHFSKGPQHGLSIGSYWLHCSVFVRGQGGGN